MCPQDATQRPPGWPSLGHDIVQVFEVVIQVIVQVGGASAHSIANTGQGERGRGRGAAPDVGPNDAAKGASHARERRGLVGGKYLFSSLGGNPLLFAVVVSPTLTIGALLITRPGLHPAFLEDGSGGGRRGGGGEFCPREVLA